MSSVPTLDTKLVYFAGAALGFSRYANPCIEKHFFSAFVENVS